MNSITRLEIEDNNIKVIGTCPFNDKIEVLDCIDGFKCFMVDNTLVIIKLTKVPQLYFVNNTKKKNLKAFRNGLILKGTK